MPLDDDLDDDQLPPTFDAASGRLLNPPKKRRSQVRLRSIDDVKKEMEKLYRALKGDELPPKKANSMIYVLEKIMQITVAKEYGARLEVIEERLLNGSDPKAQIPE